MSFGNSTHSQPQNMMGGHNKAPRAIVINEVNEKKAEERMIQWVEQHYPRSRLIQVAAVKQNNRIYMRVNLQTANGQQKTVFFDVTSVAQHKIPIMMQGFSAGTLARYTPGSTSTPTKVEILP